jgi:hypothetical protein
MGEFQVCIEECDAGLAIVLDDAKNESGLYLMKLFSLAAIGDKTKARKQGEIMMKKMSTLSTMTVLQLGWIDAFFTLNIPGLEEQIIVLINNQIPGYEITLHAMRMSKGENISESEFEKNSFFDALNAAKYFTQKKDNATACKFLTEAKKKMPYNTWLNQINPECP